MSPLGILLSTLTCSLMLSCLGSHVGETLWVEPLMWLGETIAQLTFWSLCSCNLSTPSVWLCGLSGSFQLYSCLLSVKNYAASLFFAACTQNLCTCSFCSHTTQEDSFVPFVFLPVFLMKPYTNARQRHCQCVWTDVCCLWPSRYSRLIFIKGLQRSYWKHMLSKSEDLSFTPGINSWKLSYPLYLTYK